MTYRTAGIAIGILVLQATRVHAQTAPAPQFDVASIKLNPSCGNRAGRGGQNPFSTGRLNMECVMSRFSRAAGRAGLNESVPPKTAEIARVNRWKQNGGTECRASQYGQSVTMEGHGMSLLDFPRGSLPCWTAR
jgi:hypothetical protein